MSTVCPSCRNVEMRTVSTGATQYETCDSCGGTFFDFKELAAEAKSSMDTVLVTEKVYRGDDAPDRLPTDARPCSRCGTQMSEREYSYDSGIHVDMCPECFSVFLNAKEFEEIKKYLSTYEKSEEMDVIRAKIPKAIETAEANMLKRVREVEERRESEYAEAIKDDWIPDFLQQKL